MCLSIGAHVCTRATERTVRARASKSNASANDTGASRSFLRSYVDLAAVSVSLPFHRPSSSLSLSLSLPPFFSYPSILLARAQSYLSSVSVPISDFYLSLSIPLYRSPPPAISLSLFLRSTIRFKRVTLFFSLSSSMIFFHTYSHSYFFRLSLSSLFLSLSLIFTLHPIVPAFLVSLLSTVRLSHSLSLPLSRFTSYAISPSRIFIIVHPVSVRTILPTPPLEFSPFQLSPSPTLSVYTFARFASPAGHPQFSISLSLPPSPSISLSLLSLSLYRTVLPVHASSTLPLVVSHSLSLSLSPSCFEHRRSTFFLAVCPPSPSRVHRDPSYPRFAETCSRGFRSSPFDPRLLSFNMSRGPFYSSPLSRNDEPGRLRPTYFVFGNAPGTWNRSDVLAFEEPSACAARSINGH